MKYLNKIIIGAVIIFTLIALNICQKQVVKHRPFAPQTAGLYKLSHPFLLKALSLGNHQSMADYLWIKLILKIGESARFSHGSETVHKHEEKAEHSDENGKHDHKTENGEEHAEEHNGHNHGPVLINTQKDTLKHEYLEKNLPAIFHNYLNTITDIDPKFAYPYHTAIVFSMFSFRDNEKIEYWLNKAIKNNPEYWEFHFYKAFYLFRIKPSPDSVIIEHLKNSVEAPKSLRIFHKNIALSLLIAFNKKLNPLQKQIIFLEGLLETVEDKVLKEKIITQIETLLKIYKEQIKGIQ